MNEYEILLKEAFALKNEYGFVNYMQISVTDRPAIQELENLSLIENVRYIGKDAVGFDLTYKGLHYFN